MDSALTLTQAAGILVAPGLSGLRSTLSEGRLCDICPLRRRERLSVRKAGVGFAVGADAVDVDSPVRLGDYVGHSVTLRQVELPMNTRSESQRFRAGAERIFAQYRQSIPDLAAQSR